MAQSCWPPSLASEWCWRKRRRAFAFGLLKKAFDEATADGFIGTDEASLVEKSGGTVHVVMGSTRNMKITTPGDLELAEFYMSKENPSKSASREDGVIQYKCRTRASHRLRLGLA